MIPAEDHGSESSIRVVSWNVEHGLRVDDAIEALREDPHLAGADVLLLQEMEASGTEAIASALELDWVYVAGTVHSKTGRDFGNAVLYRGPLELAEVVELPHTAVFWGEDRIAVGASAELAGRRLTLWSVHAEVPTMRFRKQLEQYDALAAAFATSPSEVRLMAGDFNSASTRNVARLAARLRESGAVHVTADAGPTFRRFGRSFRLDHMFTSGLRPLRAGVTGPYPASDHCPIYADFRVE